MQQWHQASLSIHCESKSNHHSSTDEPAQELRKRNPPATPAKVKKTPSKSKKEKAIKKIVANAVAAESGKDQEAEESKESSVAAAAEADEVMEDAEKALPYKVVVVDIEGTTTPISFVHDVLFPHVTTHIETFLNAHWGEPELESKIEALRTQFGMGMLDADKRESKAEEDVKNNVEGIVPILDSTATPEDLKKSIAENIRWQMSIDRKIGALKSFQGYMWRFAYEDGSVKGSVFEDVVPVLEFWKSKNIPVYVYSSGSVEAQKLLFGFSEKGDLLAHFSGHFDTAIGSKLAPASYTAIATSISHGASDILFLSDNVLEIAAAKKVGFKAAVMFRKGNKEVERVEGKPGRAVVKVEGGEDGVEVNVVEEFWETVKGDVEGL
ncbi:Enolase-phosphatase E1 [Phlyctochytrium planicorne]|nr:Enolase-phosphatase E1 [Phlyctochytrium planicorne]